MLDSNTIVAGFFSGTIDFAEYTASIDARGPEAAVGEYLARHVYGPPTWDDYLELFDGERLARQRAAAKELTG